MAAIKTPNRCMNNIVKKEQLRAVQKNTLSKLKEALLHSAGPYGSTTQIVKADPANPNSQMVTQYTKDGHTILKNIKFNMAIEDSIQRELTDVTRHIKNTVGDGSTSTIVLSSIIFDKLLEIEEDKYPPYIIIDTFKKVVKRLQEIIKSNARELTLEDVRKIAMICTNNNEDVSDIIYSIYAEYGLDVFIDVGVSSNENDIIKTYDGLTIETGYSDPVYINTKAKSKTDEQAGYSIIRNAKVYSFTDPIDTLEMHQLFNIIVFKNILEPWQEYQKTGNRKSLQDMVPTVIMAPKISLDMNESFDSIVQFLYGFNQNMDAKPPLLIISNISGVNYEAYSDIWNLCGCKPIKKYIDPAIQKQEIENGNAPTKETVVDFCGSCDQVKADAYKTTFINPSNMFAKDEDGEFKLDEEGERIFSEAYKTQIAFLEQQLKVAKDQGQGPDITGNLKRRIHSLKANMVDYFVGGITSTDRDATRVLVEDAVKNIRSAATGGVGFGTNYEGLKAITEYRDTTESDGAIFDIISKAINDAYKEMSVSLYSTVYYEGIDNKEEYINKLIADSVIGNHNGPMNFVTKEFDGSVLCTIDQDIVILDVISKIITIMYTTNQTLTQTVQHNLYVDMDEI